MVREGWERAGTRSDLQLCAQWWGVGAAESLGVDLRALREKAEKWKAP